MSNAKKIIVIITVTLVVMSLFAVSYAVSKGFNPLMIPVDKENLPEHILEGDLEDGHISAHRLEEISKELGETVFLESSNGRTYEARHNMVLSEETVVDTAKEAFLTALGEYMKKINSIDFSTYEGENRGKVESLVREYSDKEFEYSPEAMEELKGEIASFEEKLAEIPTGPTLAVAEPVTNPEPTVEPESTQPTHEHSWTHIAAEYTTIHHDAEFTDVWVVDVPASEEWVDEEVYELVSFTEIRLCDKLMNQTGSFLVPTSEFYDYWDPQGTKDIENGFHCGYSTAPDQLVLVGYEKKLIQTPEEGHWEKKLVKEAWDEQVLVHGEYDVCSSCGITR